MQVLKKHKFMLLTAAILLTGAVVAGIAAWAVVSPPMGKTVSAGVLNVPSVPGLTADEILFPPWDHYGIEKLYPLPEETYSEFADYVDFPIEDLEKMSSTELLSSSQRAADFVQGMFFSEGVTFQVSDVMSRLRLNYDPSEAAESESTFSLPEQRCLYLKGVPATVSTLSGKEAPATIDFAYSISYQQNCISLLIRPSQPETLSDETIAAARSMVEEDVRDLLRLPAVVTNALVQGDVSANVTESSNYVGITYQSDVGVLSWDPAYFLNHWVDLYGETSRMGPYLYALLTSQLPLDGILNLLHSTLSFGDLPPEDESLEYYEERLDENANWSTQIVVTPSQVVVLFTLPHSYTVGVYYDIQLGCYSGFGLIQE